MEIELVECEGGRLEIETFLGSLYLYRPGVRGAESESDGGRCEAPRPGRPG
jgi:hypothetical protein